MIRHPDLPSPPSGRGPEAAPPAPRPWRPPPPPRPPDPADREEILSTIIDLGNLAEPSDFDKIRLKINLAALAELDRRREGELP
jgi:hypothetical protein